MVRWTCRALSARDGAADAVDDRGRAAGQSTGGQLGRRRLVEQPPRRPAAVHAGGGQLRRVGAGQRLRDRRRLALPETSSQTSSAALIAAKPRLTRVGGGLGQSRTAKTGRSSRDGRRLREDRGHVPLRAHAEQQHVEPRDGAAVAARPRPARRRTRRRRPRARRTPPSDGGMAWTRCSGHADAVQQRLAGLLLVALVVVGGHEALVAPPDVDRRPVDRLAPGSAARAATCSSTAMPTPPPVSTTDAVPCTACAAASRATSASAAARARCVGVRLDDDVRAPGALTSSRLRRRRASSAPATRVAVRRPRPGRARRARGSASGRPGRSTPVAASSASL